MKLPKVKHVGYSVEDKAAELTRKYGCRIGSGRDAQVWKVDDNTVVKLHSTYTNNWDKDPYTRFLRLLPEDNPYFPKIYSIKRYHGKPGNMYGRPRFAVIFMERLFHETHYLAWAAESTGAELHVPADFDKIRHYINDIMCRCAEIPQTIGDEKALEALTVLRDMAQPNVYFADMSGANVMARKSTPMRLVVVDPLC